MAYYVQIDGEARDYPTKEDALNALWRAEEMYKERLIEEAPEYLGENVTVEEVDELEWFEMEEENYGEWQGLVCTEM